MPRLRVHNLSISLDGYAAGPDQGLDHPLGVGGERLHEWATATAAWQGVHGRDGGERGVDDDLIARGEDGIGATAMGRNMFGPVRVRWPDERWTGWWGEDSPFHQLCLVVCNHPRRPM